MTEATAMRAIFTRMGCYAGEVGCLFDEGDMSELDDVSFLQDQCIENLVKKL
jgi:hypothetical protein